MSRFSECLKKILEERGESVSSVARCTGVERTSIHKALSDERQLSYKSVMALIRHFQLSVEERKEFLQAYDVLLQGEDTWRNRQAVCDVFDYLSVIQFDKKMSGESSLKSDKDSPRSEIETGLVEGEFAVRNVVHSILEYEVQHIVEAKTPQIRVFLPADMDLTMELMEMWMDGKDFQVEQIFCLDKVIDKDCSQNIRLLQQMIPCCLVSRGGVLPILFL